MKPPTPTSRARMCLPRNHPWPWIASPRYLLVVIPPTFGLILAASLSFAYADPLPAQCPNGSPPPCGPVRIVTPRVQVLNFTASDTADEYLAAGIADDLRAALLGSHGVVLVGPRARAGAE